MTDREIWNFKTKYGSIFIKISKKSTAFMIVYLAFSVFAFFSGTGVSWKAAGCFLGAACLLSCMEIQVYGKPWMNRVLVWGIFVFGSIVTAFLSQMFLDAQFWGLGLLRAGLNSACCLTVTSVLFFLTGRWKTSVMASSFLLMGFTIIDEMVAQGRGTDLIFCDIFNVQTALNVMGQYTFSVSRVMLYAFAILLLFWILLWNIHFSAEFRTVGWRCSGVLAGMLCVAAIFVGKQYITVYRFADTVWYNGFFLNFTYTITDAFVEKPIGYSSEVIEELEERFVLQEDTRENPSIIVIMNESFADFEKLGQLNIDEEILPFYHSLSENVIKGYALSSIFAGGTPNSEYEFLTGNSVAFLPEGSSAYRSYVENPTYSMVSELKSRGYTCTAMHPFLSSGWNRTKVYPLLGFDQMLFLEDFPQKNLVREYVSDREMYEKILEVYRNGTGKQFIFGVTMQNHGDYLYDGDHYEKTVSLCDDPETYPRAEQYLSLMKESDKALNYLLDEFSKEEEDVVIVFFGDHQPNLDEGFFEYLTGTDGQTLEEQQLQYEVPFFIWANYDIEEKSIPRTSLNFLSSYVYDVAGIGLPVYNQFLRDVEQEIYAMNRIGYYCVQEPNVCHSFKENDQKRGLLWEYQCLAYNSLFDFEQRSDHFFPVDSVTDLEMNSKAQGGLT